MGFANCSNDEREIKIRGLPSGNPLITYKILFVKCYETVWSIV